MLLRCANRRFARRAFRQLILSGSTLLNRGRAGHLRRTEELLGVAGHSRSVSPLVFAFNALRLQMQTRSLSALHCGRLADTDPQISRNIPKAAFQSIARLQRRMVMLGQTSALEKVSAFRCRCRTEVIIARAALCFCRCPDMTLRTTSRWLLRS